MKSLIIVCFAICMAFPCHIYSQKNEENWPNWRGPNMDGVSPSGKPPIDWSESHNIKWKIPILGRGFGTPIVWGNKIFITTAIELEGDESLKALQRINKSKSQSEQLNESSLITDIIIQFKVYSISLINGEILWEKVVREQIPFVYIGATYCYTSSSCVTDGTYVIATFGSYGVYCFDMDGEQQWVKDFGLMEDPLSIGDGSSPYMHNNKVIFVWDHAGASKIFALDKHTGNLIWQKDRNEHNTWASPIVVNVNGQAQVLVAGNERSVGYNPSNGDEIWHIDFLNNTVIPSPVFDGTRAFFMSGHRDGKIQAINLIGAHGDLNDSEAELWIHDQHNSYVPSPLLLNGKLYFLRESRAQISCIDAENGLPYYNAIRPKGMMGTYSSPVAANGYIYILDNRGLCSVIEEGTSFKLIQQNKLQDTFESSPAIAGDQLILRGSNSMYCISK